MTCGIKVINYSILIFVVVLALLIIVVIIKAAGIVPKK
jgi:hypothetical protein